MHLAALRTVIYKVRLVFILRRVGIVYGYGYKDSCVHFVFSVVRQSGIGKYDPCIRKKVNGIHFDCSCCLKSQVLLRSRNAEYNSELKKTSFFRIAERI